VRAKGGRAARAPRRPEGRATEERRFDENDYPTERREQWDLLDGDFQFHVKRKSPPVKEGMLRMRRPGRFSSWRALYFVLDVTEKYFACYDKVRGPPGLAARPCRSPARPGTDGPRVAGGAQRHLEPAADLRGLAVRRH
jgi:hypothetical protein